MIGNLRDLSPAYFTLLVLTAWFFLTLYPRKGNGDYPNDLVSKCCRQLPCKGLYNIQNIPAVNFVRDIYNQWKQRDTYSDFPFFSTPNWTQITIYSKTKQPDSLKNEEESY